MKQGTFVLHFPCPGTIYVVIDGQVLHRKCHTHENRLHAHIAVQTEEELFISPPCIFSQPFLYMLLSKWAGAGIIEQGSQADLYELLLSQFNERKLFLEKLAPYEEKLMLEDAQELTYLFPST
jgi:hypothetical protein